MAKPRSLKVFGVAGALSSSCTVFYTSDFRSRNIGRFSDLITAKIKDLNVDELRVRALLLFALYESYAAQWKGFGPENEVLPTSLEVGFDADQLAIGVSLHWKEERNPILQGVTQRVPKGIYQTPFEEILGFLRQHCAKLIIKHEQTERRIEIVTLIDRHDPDRRDPMEVVEVDSLTAPYMEASEYVEMGDLDYLGLLSEESATPIADLDEEDLNAIVEEPFDAENDDVVHIPGSHPDEPEDEVIRVSGRSLEPTEEEVRVVKSSKKDEEDREPILVRGQKAEEEESGNWMPTFLKKVFSFGEEDPKSSKKSLGPAPETRTIIEGADPETQKLIDELKVLASEKNGSTEFQNVIAEIESEADGGKGKRWAEGLMASVIQEKARLADLSAELALQARTKENEYQTKERAFLSELKRLEEQAKKKETALERSKETIAQLNMALERARSGPSADVELQLKHKLTTTQKIVQQKEEENRLLSQKVKSLEDRLIVAQARSSRPSVDPQMASKLQAAERKAEEFKRLNQRLTESMNQQKQSAGKDDAAGLRRKIEALERQSTEAKKSMDKLQFRLREAQEAERKVQFDLSKALDENRKLRGGRPGSGEAA